MKHLINAILFCSWILTMTVTIAFAAAPPLREEVNLEGKWNGGNVPQLVRGETGQSHTWSRTFSVPASWSGKKIFIELETVNYSPVTRINGTEVGRITGSRLPHSHDITDHVTPGSTNNSVAISATGTCPPGWPEGFRYSSNNAWAGLIHDIYLRAYD